MANIRGMWELAFLLFLQLATVFAADCTSQGTSSPYIDPNSGACYVAECTYVGTAPKLSFSTGCSGCVSDGGTWLGMDQQGIPFSWDNGVTCRRAICNATTAPNIGTISISSSECQNQIYCNPPATGDSNKHPAGTSWPVATADGCFQYFCTATGTVTVSASSTHCCVSSALTSTPQYYSPGSWIPAHNNGTTCIKQQCMFKGANVGSSLADTVVDQSQCGTAAPAVQCSEVINGVTNTYNDGQVFGDFVQVRKVSGDGFECKRKKCVNGVIILWPTLNDPNCPPVARQTQTTTATVVVTGPGDSTSKDAGNDLASKVTGDSNDPGRVVVVTTLPVSSPTAVSTCSWSGGGTKPEGFQYRVQSNDADHHCVDRICRGGVWLGVPSPSGATCTTTPDVTPFSNNPQAQGFTLQTTTNTYQITLSMKVQEDVSRLQSLFNNPSSILRTGGTFTAQSVVLTNGTMIYTCSNGVTVTNSGDCTSSPNGGFRVANPCLFTFLLIFLLFAL